MPLDQYQRAQKTADRLIKERFDGFVPKKVKRSLRHAITPNQARFLANAFEAGRILRIGKPTIAVNGHVFALGQLEKSSSK